MAHELILDGENSIKPHGSLVYALNKVKDDIRQNLLNEDGFLNETSEFTTPVTDIRYCGKIDTPTGIVFFMAYDSFSGGKESIISYFNDKDGVDTITTILRTVEAAHLTGLGFSPINPIQGTFTYNGKSELIISFIEGIKDTANPLRYLNIDDVGIELNASKYPINPIDVLQLNSNKPLKLPVISFNSVSESGGNLKNGVYSIFVAYSDEYKNRTNFITSLNPVTVYYESAIKPYIEIFDAPINTLTGKAIKIDISNLSSFHDHIAVGVIYKSNSSDTAYVREYDYIGGSISIIIDNLEIFDKTSVTDITVDNLIYDKVNAITKFDNQLLIGNLTVKQRDINFQKVALGITVSYDTFVVKTQLDNPTSVVNSYKDNEFIVNSKTFQPNEVYAFYLQPIYLDGSIGEEFTIPGRLPLTASYEVISGNMADEDAIVASTGGGPGDLPGTIDTNHFGFMSNGLSFGSDIKLFQIRNTADLHSGKLGVWVNKDEIYPSTDEFNGSIDVRGDKVRHHRIPDFKRYWDASKSAKTLGIKLTFNNIIIPADLSAKISGYRITMAKRNATNSIVVDEALANHIIYDDFSDYSALKGNAYRTLQSSNVPLLESAPTVIVLPYPEMSVNKLTDSDSFMLIPPLTMKFNNPLSYDMIQIENIIQRTFENRFFSTIGIAGESYCPLFDSYNISQVSVPNIDSFAYYPVSQLDNIVKVDETFYTNNKGIYTNKIDMTRSINGVYLKSQQDIYKLVTGLTIPDTGSAFGTNVSGQNYVTATLGTNEQIYGKFLLMNYRENTYLSFFNQKTAVIGEVLVGTTSLDVTGDSYISAVAIRTKGHFGANVCVLPYCCSTNFELRTPDNGTIDIRGSEPQPTEDNFFSQNDLAKADLDKTWGGTLIIDDYPTSDWKWTSLYSDIYNYWGEGIRSIKPDWSKLNDYKVGIIYTPTNIFLNKFPYRVAKSLPIKTENLINAWLIFKSEYYQDMDNSKGQIQTLNAGDKALYIRQEYALFVYQLKDSLEVLGQAISLASNDIFTNRAEEIIADSHGYIGSNSRFNSLVTPFGYYIVDVVKKHIFKVIGAKAKDISPGVQIFLNSHLLESNRNPYFEGDTILGFNDFEKMIYLTSNDVSHQLAFTLSLDIYGDSFLSFHSYVPTMYSNTNRSLYTLKSENSVYKFGFYKSNYKYTKCKFYEKLNGTTPLDNDVVDTVFNLITSTQGQSGVHINKQLNFVSWNTNTYIMDSSNNKTINQDETVHAIVVYSDTQCTLEHEVNSVDLDWHDANFGRNIQNIWSFNDILDAVNNSNDAIILKDFSLNTSNLSLKDYYDMSNFIGTFVIIRLIHKNNYIDSNNNQYEQAITMTDVNFKPDNR